MLRAIAFLRAQLTLLAILRLAGPSTWRDLTVYVRTYLPGLSPDQLERMLMWMHRAKVVTVLRPFGPYHKYWALPGQQVRAGERRQQHKPILAERRTGVDRRQAVPAPGRSGKESWWVAAGPTREQWTAAVSQRWDS
jgi:hypothetical protein